ncbi:MAG: hypothetical protein SFX73_22760 [Kofleriaceae bacterium]|nr:hypothetical protein [Kofleriaceae bacterium]
MSTQGWALATTADSKQLQSLVEGELAAAGFEKLDKNAAGSMLVQVLPHPEGALLLVNEPTNIKLARSLTAKLATETRYLELRLEATSVAGMRTKLPVAAPEDIDKEARALLHAWHEGENRTFDSERFDDLVAALLEVKNPGEPVTLAYARKLAGSPRVAALLRAVEAGGTWARATMDNQPAIKITNADGAQLTALTPDEYTEFLVAMGGSVRIKLPT